MLDGLAVVGDEHRLDVPLLVVVCGKPRGGRSRGAVDGRRDGLRHDDAVAVLGALDVAEDDVGAREAALAQQGIPPLARQQRPPLAALLLGEPPPGQGAKGEGDAGALEIRHLEEHELAAVPQQAPRVAHRGAQVGRGVQHVGRDDDVVAADVALAEALLGQVARDVERLELEPVAADQAGELVPGGAKEAGRDVRVHVLGQPRQALGAVGAVAGQAGQDVRGGAAGAGADLEDAQAAVLVREQVEVGGHLRVVGIEEVGLVEARDELRLAVEEQRERVDLAAEDLGQVAGHGRVEVVAGRLVLALLLRLAVGGGLLDRRLAEGRVVEEADRVLGREERLPGGQGEVVRHPVDVAAEVREVRRRGGVVDVLLERLVHVVEAEDLGDVDVAPVLGAVLLQLAVHAVLGELGRLEQVDVGLPVDLEADAPRAGRLVCQHRSCSVAVARRADVRAAVLVDDDARLARLAVHGDHRVLLVADADEPLPGVDANGARRAAVEQVVRYPQLLQRSRHARRHRVPTALRRGDDGEVEDAVQRRRVDDMGLDPVVLDLVRPLAQSDGGEGVAAVGVMDVVQGLEGRAELEAHRPQVLVQLPRVDGFVAARDAGLVLPTLLPHRQRRLVLLDLGMVLVRVLGDDGAVAQLDPLVVGQLVQVEEARVVGGRARVLLGPERQLRLDAVGSRGDQEGSLQAHLADAEARDDAARGRVRQLASCLDGHDNHAACWVDGRAIELTQPPPPVSQLLRAERKQGRRNSPRVQQSTSSRRRGGSSATGAPAGSTRGPAFPAARGGGACGSGCSC